MLGLVLALGLGLTPNLRKWNTVKFELCVNLCQYWCRFVNLPQYWHKFRIGVKIKVEVCEHNQIHLLLGVVR